MTKQAFNRDFYQNGPLIPWARDERTGNAVVLPNISKKRRSEIPNDMVIEEYDEAKHKGHLLCYDCDARVTAFKQVQSMAGSNTGKIPQHYTTIPNSPHWEKCETTRRREIRMEEQDPTDKTKGFRVHINSFDGKAVEEMNNQFGAAAANGPYGREGFRMRLKGPEADKLRVMETFAVSGMEDIVEFLSKKEMSRINESVFIHRNNIIPFKDFLLAYDADLENGRHKKFQRFAKGENWQGKRRQPVVMEVITDRSFGGRSTRNGMPIESCPIVIEPKREGDKAIIIRPTLISRSHEMDWTFVKPGKYLVLGIATMERVEREDSIEYTISIRVKDPAQVKKIDMADIRAENEKSQQRRNARRGITVPPDAAPVLP